MVGCKRTTNELLYRDETRKSIYPNNRSSILYPRGSKSPQSLLLGLFAILPHVGCGGFEGDNTPIPALKNGGGVCCSGGLEKAEMGLLWGRDTL